MNRSSAFFIGTDNPNDLAAAGVRPAIRSKARVVAKLPVLITAISMTFELTPDMLPSHSRWPRVLQ